MADETPVPEPETAPPPADTPAPPPAADTPAPAAEATAASEDAPVVTPATAPPPDVPPDPIITDPAMPDAAQDPIFEVPIPLLEAGAQAVVATMPDEDKTAVKDAIDASKNYWGEYEHFECPMTGCGFDSMSYADMVSHTVTAHHPEDLAAPAGQKATYDRYGNFLGYEEA
jgi:hypothetical protein